MRRRDFVKQTTMAVTAGGLLSACGTRSGGGPAIQSTQNVTWRLASSFPRSLDTIWGASEVLSDTLATLTGGRFRGSCVSGG